MTNLKSAIEAPVIINNIHESAYRAYHVLTIVQDMLERKDSHISILETIEGIYSFESNDEPKTKCGTY